MPRSDRTVRAAQLLELLLTLFRSLLLIPSAAPNARLAYLVNLHDNIIVRFHHEHILETLVLLTQFVVHEKNNTHHFLLLDCLNALVQHETPSRLFCVPEPRRAATTDAGAATTSSSAKAPKPLAAATLTSTTSAAAQRLQAALHKV